MTYQDFINAVRTAVADIRNDVADGGDEYDLIHEYADGHQYVIYTGQAWDLVNLIRDADSELFFAAEEQFSDYGGGFRCNNSWDECQRQLAFFIMTTAIRQCIDQTEVAA